MKKFLIIVLILATASISTAVSYIMNPHTGKLDAVATGGEQGPRGYDGYDGDTATCAIIGGLHSLIYDQAGLNPTPAPTSYLAAFYRNGSATSAAVQWYTPDANTHILGSPDGSATGSTFTPTIFGTFSASKGNNYVFAQFSSGNFRCRAFAPIAVSMVGATGPQGPPGDLSSLTRAHITNVLDDPSDTAVTLQPASNSGTVPMVSVRDYLGNVRQYTDSSGYQYFKDTNGYALVRLQTDGSIYLFNGNNQRLRLANDGTITTYRGNGTTPGFQTYSGAQWRGREGLPISNGLCLAGNTDGSKYWTTCGSGGGTPGGSSKQIQWNNNGSFAGFGRYSTVTQTVIIKKLVIE